MDPTTFDRLARLLAARRSRRAALRAGGAGLAAALAARRALAQGTPAAGGALAANNATLFVQTASGGSLPPHPMAGAPPLTGGAPPAAGATPPPAPPTYLLTLTGHAGETVAFADRPRRETAVVPTPHFFQGMFVRGNPPNAALVADVGQPRQAVVLLELFEPQYDAARHTLSYGAELLRAYPNAKGEALQAVAARPEGRAPAAFGQAALFIDDCPDLTVCRTNKGGPQYYLGPLPDGPVGQCWDWGALSCDPCNGVPRPEYDSRCHSGYPDQCYQQGVYCYAD